MGTLSVSSTQLQASSTENSPSLISEMGTSSPQYEYDAPPFNTDSSCLEADNVFDDRWWEGAEELDLTLPSKDEFEENAQISNETNSWDIDCQFLLRFPPPPSWANFPPPPMPPFLKEIEPFLQDLGELSNVPQGLGHPHTLSKLRGTIESASLKKEEPTHCSLCSWAMGGNQTINLFAKRQTESTAHVGRGLIGALIGVTFVSAALGAAMMRLFLRCRSGSSLEFVIKPCSISARMLKWPQNSSPNVPIQSGALSSESSKPQSLSGMEWAVKRWRRGSSQAPLHLSSSPASENSYVEEYCINNFDSHSGINAELEPDNRSLAATHEPEHKGNDVSTGTSSFARTCSSPILQSRYDEEGPVKNGSSIPQATPRFIAPHFLDETSSGGQANIFVGTPATDYYGEPLNELLPDRKKKLSNSLTKNNIGTHSISSHIQYHPVQLNINTSYNPNRITSLRKDSITMPLQLLPKHLTTDHNFEYNGTSEVWNSPGKSSYFPYQKNIRYFPTPGQHTLSFPDSTETIGFSKGELQAQRQNHPSLRPNESHGQLLQPTKPLPPLPSRRVNGPKRRKIAEVAVEPDFTTTHPSNSVYPK